MRLKRGDGPQLSPATLGSPNGQGADVRIFAQDGNVAVDHFAVSNFDQRMPARRTSR
jgi:hypothetical protein